MSTRDTQSERFSPLRPRTPEPSVPELPPPGLLPEEPPTAVQDLSTVVMPGRAESVAEEIHDVSPEGSPGDPKAGPGALLAAVGGMALLVVAAAVAMGIWFSWAAGAVVAALGLAAMFFNPVVLATLLRAGERKEVLEHRRRNDPLQHPERPHPRGPGPE